MFYVRHFAHCLGHYMTVFLILFYYNYCVTGALDADMAKAIFTVLKEITDLWGKHTQKQAISVQSDKKYDLKNTGSCKDRKEGADIIRKEQQDGQEFYIKAVF